METALTKIPTIAELTMDFDSEIWKDVPSYHGVSKKGDKWIARININNKRLWLGTFNSEIEAHSAYQTKLKLTK